MSVNIAYVSGALTGVDDSAARKLLYEQLGDVLKSHGYNPYLPHHHTDPEVNPEYTPQQVYRINRNAVTNATLLVAVVDIRALGTGAEVELANQSGIPIILLYRAGTQKTVSRHIRGMGCVIAEIEFDSDSQCVEALSQFLDKYSNEELIRLLTFEDGAIGKQDSELSRSHFHDYDPAEDVPPQIRRDPDHTIIPAPTGWLNDRGIRWAIANGEIIIKNWKHVTQDAIFESITPVGYDLRVGERAFSDVRGEVTISGDHPLVISPGEHVLVDALEDMRFGWRIGASIHTRVTLTGRGLSHVSTTIDPTWPGRESGKRLTIHMANHSKVDATLEYRQTFCTVMMFRSTVSARDSIPSQLEEISPPELAIRDVKERAENLKAEEIRQEEIARRGRGRRLLFVLLFVVVGFGGIGGYFATFLPFMPDDLTFLDRLTVAGSLTALLAALENFRRANSSDLSALVNDFLNDFLRRG